MKTIYIAFLYTPYRVGRIIRAISQNPYNHVAISLSPDLKKLYSFARLYRDTPAHGGFVEETPERYLWHRGETRVKICAISATEEAYRKVLYTLKYFSRHREESVYNHFSLLTSSFGYNVSLRGAYTCVQFVQNVLGRYFPELDVDPERFMDIRQLEDALSDRVIYEGKYPAPERCCRFDYYTPHSVSEQVKLSLETFAVLFERLLEKP